MDGVITLAQRIREELYVFIKMLVASFTIALLFNHVVILNANVPTPSMENTIPAPSNNIAFRLAYVFAEPRRLDVVVFPAPDTGELYVKRIIGLPGDVVEIKAGKVYLNGSTEPLADSYVDHPSLDDWGPRMVPANHYFMLGDNRANSHDSRRWDNTYVPRKTIQGKIIFSYYPSFKFIK